MSKTLGTVFSATLICFGIASTSAHAIPVDKTVAEKSSKDFSGIADYYADMYHGKKTASGELHDKTKFMAAHRTLPFGTKVRIVNRRNNKACVVTINDRGPFTPSRVIDLSYAAAKELGVTGGGKSVDCYVVSRDAKAGVEAEAKLETKKVAPVTVSKLPATAPIPGTAAPKEEQLRFTVTAAAPAKAFVPKTADVTKITAADTKDIALDPSTAEE